METFTNCVALLFILHFGWSYYWNCYRKGYILDVWHFTLLNLVIIIHVMLPFSRSDLNIFALGGHLRPMQAHMTQAYLISAFGYAVLLVGGALWRVSLGLGVRRVFSRVVEVPSRASLFLLQSKPLLIAHSAVALLLDTGVILYYFRSEGFGFNVGSMAIMHPGFRPFVQFAGFYSVLIGSYCCARYYARKERSMLIAFLLIVFSQLFFGARSSLVGMVTMTGLVMVLRLGRRANPLLVGLSLGVGVAVLMILNGLRQPNFSLQRVAAGLAVNIFYGNTFSDTRDFALILSEWDGRFFHGLTYLTALIAFVPRYVSSFRDTWSIGVVTAKMAELSTTEHAGFRLGPFGEVYLNFGVSGVILLGLLVGAITRLVDLRMKQAVKTLPRTNLIVFSYYFLPSVIGIAVNSTSASSVYTMLVIFGLTWLMVQVARTLRLGVLPLGSGQQAGVDHGTA